MALLYTLQRNVVTQQQQIPEDEHACRQIIHFIILKYFVCQTLHFFLFGRNKHMILRDFQSTNDSNMEKLSD